MNVTTATTLRANVVLFSVSTGIAIIPCFSVAWLPRLLDYGMPELPYQGGTFMIASLVMLLLRRYARRAFNSAREAHQVQLIEEAGPGALIASDCQRAWLVRLHLELCGLRCGD